MTRLRTLRDAESLARVFLARIEKYNATINGSVYLPEGKEHASIIRASLDLTRALADMRQGR